MIKSKRLIRKQKINKKAKDGLAVDQAGGGSALTPGLDPDEDPENGDSWKFGHNKSETKWENQMAKRGWTREQISEAIKNGQQFKAENFVNQGNGATRYVHPQTGRSVVMDNITKEIIHVGGNGFLY